jgi:hypothetical protein
MTDKEIDDLVGKLHRESRKAKRPIDRLLLDKYAVALREKHGTAKWRETVEQVRV